MVMLNERRQEEKAIILYDSMYIKFWEVQTIVTGRQVSCHLGREIPKGHKETFERRDPLRWLQAWLHGCVHMSTVIKICACKCAELSYITWTSVERLQISSCGTVYGQLYCPF